MKTCKTLLPILLCFILSCKKEGYFNDRVSPHDFLSNSPYQTLEVEVQFAGGFEPTSATISNLKTFLESRLNKSGGINIVQTTIPAPGQATYTLDNIRRIEKDHRTRHTEKGVLTAYVLLLDGEYAGNSGNSKVLGITYENSSIVLFEKTIRDYSGGIGEPSRSTLETTVCTHEFGHILGLVNYGTDMQTDHQDHTNGYHCNNQNCLMYYTAETTDILANILGGPPSLDAQCINDLRGNGGR